MQDALGVGRGQAPADLHRVLDRLARGQGTPLETTTQGLTLQKLEDDVGYALLRANVEDGEDVRVIQGGDSPRLALEPAQSIGIR